MQKFQASRFEALWPLQGSISKAVEEGRLPKFYHESDDPNRLVPIVSSPDDFMIIVSGDRVKIIVSCVPKMDRLAIRQARR